MWIRHWELSCHSLGWNLQKLNYQPNIWFFGCVSGQVFTSKFLEQDPSWVCRKVRKNAPPARPHHRIAQSHHQIPVCWSWVTTRGCPKVSKKTHHLLHVVSPAFIGLSKSICRIKVKMLLRAHSHLLTIYPLDSVSVHSGWPQWVNPARLRLAHLNHCTCLVLRRWLSHRHSDDAVRSIAFGVTDV